MWRNQDNKSDAGCFDARANKPVLAGPQASIAGMPDVGSEEVHGRNRACRRPDVMFGQTYMLTMPVDIIGALSLGIRLV